MHNSSRIFFLYDDRFEASKDIQDAIGITHFGNLRYKKKESYHRILDAATKAGLEPIHIRSGNQPSMTEFIDHRWVYWPATTVIMAEDSAYALEFERLSLAENSHIFLDEKQQISAAVSQPGNTKMFHTLFSQNKQKMISNDELISFSTVLKQPKNYTSILEIGSMMHYITTNFDARHFNSMTTTPYTVTKSSINREKMKREHDYYHLLPGHLQQFFVPTFGFQKNKKSAEYSMERLYVPDVAIQWTQQALNTSDFETLLEIIFHFIQVRDTKSIPTNEGQNIANTLYIKKIQDRYGELQQLPEYKKLYTLWEGTTRFQYFDKLLDRFIALYNKMSKQRDYNTLSVSHGDLCFSNILYGKNIRLAKFIDTRGAETIDDLYMDPYYDIAKLSHSIQGMYDYVNAGLYDIERNTLMESKIVIQHDNHAEYTNLFQFQLEKHGFNNDLVRLYEASLFLSMLPLHKESIEKMYGFSLIAESIIDELEKRI